MKVYVLHGEGSIGGATWFLGVFSTSRKAKAYAERDGADERQWHIEGRAEVSSMAPGGWTRYRVTAEKVNPMYGEKFQTP